MEHVVVVGASLAGFRSAHALREAGFGGRLSVVGDEPHMPYDRPPLSKGLLAGKMAPADCGFCTEGLDADWRLGVTATSLDLRSNIVTLDGSEPCPFDGLVIATGCSARAWRGAPMPDASGVHSLRTLNDAVVFTEAVRMAENVVVLGAGFIGCEVAATLSGAGRTVTLVDIVPTPMSALPRELGEVCAGLHRESGVTLHLGHEVTRFDVSRGRIAAVELAGGLRIAADLLLVAVGAEPNTGWLRGSGLGLGNGVVCDSTCTAAGTTNVVCAGDVASFPLSLAGGRPTRIEHWTNAAEQAAVAGANLLLEPLQRAAYDPVPSFWSDQYGIKIQVVGVPSRADRCVLLEGAYEDRKFVVGCFEGDRLVAGVGFKAPRRMPWLRQQIAMGATLPELLGTTN